MVMRTLSNALLSASLSFTEAQLLTSACAKGPQVTILLLPPTVHGNPARSASIVSIKEATHVFRQIIITALICVAINLQCAEAHPSDGQEPAPLPVGYGREGYGSPADWSFGDIVFYQPLPRADSLSNAERYMLAGTVGSRSRPGMGAWRHQVFQVLAEHYQTHGRLPVELSEAVLSSLPSFKGASSGLFEQFKSPITGRFPRLDSGTFSAGDLFVKVLSVDEVSTLSQRDPYLKAINYDKVALGGIDRSERTSARLVTPIIYMRLYGQASVIHSDVHYSWTR